MLSQRDSPPPLGELLRALSGETKEDFSKRRVDVGWWLGPPPSKGNVKDDGESEARIWVGQEERKLMRLFAGVVCREIDGGGGGSGSEAGWGAGGLGWEV